MDGLVDFGPNSESTSLKNGVQCVNFVLTDDMRMQLDNHMTNIAQILDSQQVNFRPFDIHDDYIRVMPHQYIAKRITFD